MSRTVRELLSSSTKYTERSQGVLCWLFRHVLVWRKIDQLAWNKRARKYFEKPHNQKDLDRGNLNKALTQDDFTWGTFKKAIDFLNVVSAVFVVELEWKNGKTSRYSIILDPAEDEADIIHHNDVNTDECDVFNDKSKPTNTLARLFRRIVAEENINLKRWDSLLEKSVTGPYSGIRQNRKDINSAIADLQRGLLGNRMTWNVFRRGILVLSPVSERYVLELKWSNMPGDISVHTCTITDPLSVSSKYINAK